MYFGGLAAIRLGKLSPASNCPRHPTDTSRMVTWEDNGNTREYWSLSNMGVTRYCLQVGIDSSGLVTVKELIDRLSSSLSQQI